MSTMLVVDMAVIVMLRMLVSRHMIASDGWVRSGVGVMMMSVIAMTVRVMSMMMLNCRRVRQNRRKPWPGFALGWPQRPDQSAALGPDQPDTESCDQRVAGDLDHALGAAHGLRGDVEQPGADADDQYRDQRLHQRRDERQHDTASRGLFIGDKV